MGRHRHLSDILCRGFDHHYNRGEHEMKRIDDPAERRRTQKAFEEMVDLTFAVTLGLLAIFVAQMLAEVIR